MKREQAGRSAGDGQLRGKGRMLSTAGPAAIAAIIVHPASLIPILVTVTARILTIRTESVTAATVAVLTIATTAAVAAVIIVRARRIAEIPIRDIAMKVLLIAIDEQYRRRVRRLFDAGGSRCA